MDDGSLDEIFPGVATLAGTAITPLVRVAAAVESVGGGAMASHRSSAMLWGHEIAGDDPVDVITPGRDSRVRTDGIRQYRPRDLLDLRPVIRLGVATTNPLRCLSDLGAVAPDHVDPFLGHLRIHGIVSLGAARGALERHSGKGRQGITALRDAIAQHALLDKPPDSVLETGMARLAARFGLPPMTFHAIVAGYEVDFLVDDTPVVIECEGWESHGLDREQFDRDRIRAAVIVAAGHVILPLTWDRINRQPALAAADIRTAVARWQGSVARL